MTTWIVNGRDRYGSERQFRLRGPASEAEAMRFAQQIADVMRRNAIDAGAADPELRMSSAHQAGTDTGEPLGHWRPHDAQAIDLEMYACASFQ